MNGMLNSIKTMAAATAFVFWGTASSAVPYTYDVATQGFLGTIACEDCGWLDAGDDYDFSTAGETLPATIEYVTDPLSLYLLDPDNSGLQNEVNHLNLLTGMGFDWMDYTQDDVSSLSDFIFAEAGYLILKFGAGQTIGFDHLFLYVAAGGSVSYSGKALSHITYDSMAVVPLPAAGLLLLGGLGSLAMVRRRRNRGEI